MLKLLPTNISISYRSSVIMDMVGKAMFSQQVGKFKDDFGFNEEEKQKDYDPEKWAEEDAKVADQKWANLT